MPLLRANAGSLDEIHLEAPGEDRLVVAPRQIHVSLLKAWYGGAVPGTARVVASAR